jgi:hypothetical protein
MREAIPQLPQYAFMTWCSAKNSTGTTLPFTLSAKLAMLNHFNALCSFLYSYVRYLPSVASFIFQNTGECEQLLEIKNPHSTKKLRAD